MRLNTLLAMYGHLIDVGLIFAIDLTIYRFKLKRLVVNERVNIDSRCLRTISQRLRTLDGPLIAGSAPHTFAKTSLGIEDPRSNLTSRRIPSDDLRAFQFDVVTDTESERTGQEM